MPDDPAIRRQLRLHLDALRAAGVDYLPTYVPLPFVPDAPAPAAGPDPAEARRVALDLLASEVARCDRCPELFSTRTQTVFGVGPLSPDLCFVGEAPGGDEDRVGEPFVGAAGQLLNKIIAAMGLNRNEVYIMNTIKCRPPANRQPAAAETANCRGFFDRQLELVTPKVICCLGGVAAKHLLKTTTGITRLRGRFHDFGGVPLMCTYHPSYLLRLQGGEQQAAKAECWDDMKQILRHLGRPIPGGKA